MNADVAVAFVNTKGEAILFTIFEINNGFSFSPKLYRLKVEMAEFLDDSINIRRFNKGTI
ncbi:MAG: hypothetical protein J5554_00790 [Paludibacteraceae bacterium]|nr:hypothetical protein [Paludibacteraceae bacterium]